MDMRSIVAGRVAKLQELDAAALRSLPAHSKENLPSNHKIVVSQYHEVAETGEHWIVVQGIQDRWLGLSTAIEVDGFVVESDGTRRPLTEPEKWPYT
jgi:hypothetical protein